MFPLRDENPSGIRPIITYSILGLNVLAFIWQMMNGIEMTAWRHGFVPAAFLSDPMGNTHRIFTSMFLHGGILHIFGNMLFLSIFGDNIEAAFGRAGYFVLYLFWGVIATFGHMLFNTSSTIPAIGASGAISGVLGAYFVLFPNAKVVTIMFWGYFTSMRKIKSFYYLGFWFVWQQLLPAFLYTGVGVAFWAHISGFLIGALSALPLRGRFRRRRELERRPYEWEYRYPY